jgi:hypothetical protein
MRIADGHDRKAGNAENQAGKEAREDAGSRPLGDPPAVSCGHV